MPGGCRQSAANSPTTRSPIWWPIIRSSPSRPPSVRYIGQIDLPLPRRCGDTQAVRRRRHRHANVTAERAGAGPAGADRRRQESCSSRTAIPGGRPGPATGRPTGLVPLVVPLRRRDRCRPRSRPTQAMAGDAAKLQAAGDRYGAGRGRGCRGEADGSGQSCRDGAALSARPGPSARARGQIRGRAAMTAFVAAIDRGGDPDAAGLDRTEPGRPPASSSA